MISPRAVKTTLLLLSMLLAAGNGSMLHASGFSFKAGFGYEFLSQEYFLDSLSQSGADSLAIVTALKTTYIDDIKGQFSIIYSPRKSRKLEARSTLEQTPDYFRLRLAGDYRPSLGNWKLDWLNELDWRQNCRDSTESGGSYLYGYSRARLKAPLGKSIVLWWQVRSDFVQFDSSTTYSFNYYRLGGKVGVTQYLAGLSTIDLNLFFMSRMVPDSSRLEYKSYGAEASFLGFHSGGEIDLYANLEARDYNRPLQQDDYFRLELDGRNKLNISQHFFSRQEVELEGFFFRESDDLSYDYTRLELTLITGLEHEGLAVGLGPKLELYREQSSSISSGEDYLESGLKVDIDFVSVGKVFGSLESVTGLRNIENEGELRSDFVFERLDLMADWRLLGSFNWNILLSAEWEWHDIEEENSQLFLISTGLYCSF